MDVEWVHDPRDVHVQLGAVAPSIVDTIVARRPDGLHAQSIRTVDVRESLGRRQVKAGIDVQRLKFGLADGTDEPDVVLHAPEDGPNADVDVSKDALLGN